MCYVTRSTTSFVFTKESYSHSFYSINSMLLCLLHLHGYSRFLWVLYVFFTQRCSISSVCDSIVCGLYFTQRCVINSVYDSFVCGSVGPNPHALSALTMST